MCAYGPVLRAGGVAQLREREIRPVVSSSHGAKLDAERGLMKRINLPAGCWLWQRRARAREGERGESARAERMSPVNGSDVTTGAILQIFVHVSSIPIYNH